eukprot:PhM_4_TR12456/c0_g1_i1/m.26489
MNPVVEVIAHDPDAVAQQQQQPEDDLKDTVAVEGSYPDVDGAQPDTVVPSTSPTTARDPLQTARTARFLECPTTRRSERRAEHLYLVRSRLYAAPKVVVHDRHPERTRRSTSPAHHHATTSAALIPEVSKASSHANTSRAPERGTMAHEALKRGNSGWSFKSQVYPHHIPGGGDNHEKASPDPLKRYMQQHKQRQHDGDGGSSTARRGGVGATHRSRTAVDFTPSFYPTDMGYTAIRSRLAGPSSIYKSTQPVACAHIRT